MRSPRFGMEIDVDPEQPFHVVIDGAAQALSLDDLAERYQADAIGDETLIWQEGFTDWMRLDALLAALGDQGGEPQATMSAPQSAADPTKYRVVFASDDVKSMPLSALADAHRLGVVDDDTLVQAPGGADWVPLAVIIAGFAMNAPRSVPPSQAPTERAPVQQSVQQQAPAPQGYYQQPAQQQGAFPSPHSLPQAPNTLAPTAANVGAGLPSVPPNARVPSGLDDLDFPAFQSSKPVWLKRSAIGVGALAAVFGLYQATNGPSGEVSAEPAARAAALSESAVPRPEKEAEPSDWEKEKALMEEARRRDEELAKAAKSPSANAFGASLSGEPVAEKPATSTLKGKSPPKAKKGPSSANAGKLQYDPMNGAL